MILFDASSLEATVERDCNFLGAYGLITFTIRSVECVLLTSKAHCEACEKYNSTLRASLSRHVRGGRERKVNGGRVHMVPGQRWCRLDSGLKGTTPVSTRFNKVRQERFNKKGSTRKVQQERIDKERIGKNFCAFNLNLVDEPARIGKNFCAFNLNLVDEPALST